MNRKFGFVNIGCGIFSTHIADPDGNADAMTAILKAARERDVHDVDVLLFPELAITGYTCGDLFLQNSLIRRAEQALNRLLHAAAEICPSIIICAGLPVRQGDTIFNAAALFQGGRLLGVVPKTYVPNSQEFYERRWFAPSWARTGDSITLCGATVPFTPDLIVETPSGIRIACEICEDLWVPVPPSSKHALMGANIILNPSASNEVATKSRYRRDLVRMQSGRCLCAYAYASSGPGESSTDLVFSGHCLVAVNGAMRAESRDRMGLTYALVDIERLTNDRMKDVSFAHRPVSQAEVAAYTRVAAEDPIETGIMPEHLTATPFVPQGGELGERCQEILHLQSAGLAQRVAQTGTRCLLIGVSGGLDSTLALLVAADACDRLKLPRTCVHGVTMPGYGTTDHTRGNALKLMELLGVQSRSVDIRAACEQHFQDIGQQPGVYDVTFENAQARERTQILMYLSNKEGGLVVGTGDMSELALGWATYNGDHMSMYG
ncbi:MAG: NAD(+) synthase, partial [Desulfovibrionaceae bacterium]|nr:NAD(+) synthase [Desulfovibrionaceae bacterium]